MPLTKRAKMTLRKIAANRAREAVGGEAQLGTEEADGVDRSLALEDTPPESLGRASRCAGRKFAKSDPRYC